MFYERPPQSAIGCFQQLVASFSVAQLTLIVSMISPSNVRTTDRDAFILEVAAPYTVA